MSFNKRKFKENLDCKNYSYCIYILHEEIKNLLISYAKKNDENFVYTNLCSLKNKCLNFLDYEKKLFVIEFYDVSTNPRNELYELNKLLEIYGKLKNKS